MFLRDDFKRVAKRRGIEEEELKDMFHDFFGYVRNMLEDPTVPPVFIKYLGTFRPTVGRFNWLIRSIIRRARAGYMTKEEAYNRIRIIWPIRYRLKMEMSNTDENTWESWRPGGTRSEAYKRTLEKYAKTKKQEEKEGLPPDSRDEGNLRDPETNNQ